MPCHCGSSWFVESYLSTYGCLIHRIAHATLSMAVAEDNPITDATPDATLLYFGIVDVSHRLEDRYPYPGICLAASSQVVPKRSFNGARPPRSIGRRSVRVGEGAVSMAEGLLVLARYNPRFGRLITGPFAGSRSGGKESRAEIGG